MKIKGWPLRYFETGEWQVVDERLKGLEKLPNTNNGGFNPRRAQLFEALRATPLAETKVAIIGQDPYPGSGHATGIAFSVPSTLDSEHYPVTLRTILDEYKSDLGYSMPSSGDLSSWCKRGVLLWNAIPSCRPGAPLSHDWPGGEWGLLTTEIVTLLSKQGITFALLGQVARRYLPLIGLTNNNVITTSHPSPRGSMNSKSPFRGSRLFSTINAKLVDNGQTMIDWKLP